MPEEEGTLKAAIYTRISQDDELKEARARTRERANTSAETRGLAVKRQEADCRAKAEALGWDVVDVYTDNDTSASNGKKRPGFEQLLDDIAAGKIEAIVAYSSSRMYRRPADLQRLIDLARNPGIEIATIVSGKIDLDTADGRMLAGVLAQFDQSEIERMGERIRRKSAEIAAAGRPHGGGVRPLGYRYEPRRIEKDGTVTDGNYVVVPEEAEVVQGVVKGILEGRSMTSMVRELNERGLTTTKGARWTVPTMGKVIRNPVVAGLRTYKGTTVRGTWEPIITQEEQELASRMLTANHRGVMWAKGTKPKYLLSGLMRCAHCGGKLYFTKQGGGTYFCSVPGGGKGCVRIKKGIVEGFVWMSAMEERPRPVRKNTLGSDQAMKLAKQRLQALERRDALAQQWARGSLDDRSYGVAMRTIDADVSELDSKLAQLPAPQQGFRKLFGTDMTLEERREYLTSVTKSITVSKGRVVEDRVVITWA